MADVLRAAARSVELVADPLDPGQVLDGDPRASVAVLADGGDGGESGVWRCTPGRFRDVEVAETFVVLEGRATIEHEGGSVELGRATSASWPPEHGRSGPCTRRC